MVDITIYQIMKSIVREHVSITLRYRDMEFKVKE